MNVLSKDTYRWTLWLFIDLLVFGVFAFLAWRYFPNQQQTADQMNSALRMLHGEMPYVTIAAEYPPLVYLFYFLPALFFRSLVSYYAAYMVELLLFDLLAMWLIKKISARLRISVTRSLVAHAILLVVVGPILVASFDIIPAVLMLVALYFFIEGRNNWAWVFAGLGFMTKIFPAVIVPLFILYLWRHRQFKQIAVGAVLIVAVIVVLSLPWLILNAKGYSVILIYELQRGLHSESVSGSILLMGKILGVVKVGGIYNYGSWNLSAPSADKMAALSFYVMLAMLILVFFLYWRTLRNKEDNERFSSFDTLKLMQFSAASLFILIVSGKVLSMQYLVWLMPLLLFIRGRWQVPLYAAFVAAGIFSQFIYPYNYSLFENFSPPVVILMLFRNLLLVTCAVLVLLPYDRKPEVDS